MKKDVLSLENRTSGICEAILKEEKFDTVDHN